jgi:hypothetical protein
MFRRKIFDAVGGYRSECEFWEDQDLVVRMAEAAQVAIITEPLYQVRQWTDGSRTAPNPDQVENALDLMYRSVRRLEEGRGYDDLLEDPGPADRKLDPRVFISSGMRTLGAGGRPRLFKRLLRRGRLGLNTRTLASLVWTAWASLSPSTLRQMLKFILKARNKLASSASSIGGPVLWSPLGGSLCRVESKALSPGTNYVVGEQGSS